MKLNFYRNSIGLITVMLAGLILSGCNRTVGPTTVIVEHAARHYYPIVMGRELRLKYVVTNTGNEPLVINDIQPSCGCIVLDRSDDMIILPGKDMELNFKFDSSKNSGYVAHVIRIYGNVKPRGYIELKYDVNVVPPSDYVRDYEQVFEERQEREAKAGIKEAVDGRMAEPEYSWDE